jgi:GNAT superfamily N-acetyltransferase
MKNKDTEKTRTPAEPRKRAVAAAMGGEGLELEFRPLTPERWGDFEALFGARGACGGCWCMFFRLTRSEFERGKGDGNRAAMKALVDGGEVPGILAYAAGEPVGWCAVAPRERYGALARSRVLAPLDASPVWSVVCFFVARPFRRRGVSERLLRAACDWAAGRGADTVEGYPTEPKKGSMPDVFAYMGLPSAFARAGFSEVARRSPQRPIVRRRSRVEG